MNKINGLGAFLKKVLWKSTSLTFYTRTHGWHVCQGECTRLNCIQRVCGEWMSEWCAAPKCWLHWRTLKVFLIFNGPHISLEMLSPPRRAKDVRCISHVNRQTSRITLLDLFLSFATITKTYQHTNTYSLTSLTHYAECITALARNQLQLPSTLCALAEQHNEMVVGKVAVQAIRSVLDNKTTSSAVHFGRPHAL